MNPPPFSRALRLPRAAGHRVHRAGPGIAGIGVLFEHDDADASSGEERPEHHSGGPTPGDAALHRRGAIICPQGGRLDAHLHRHQSGRPNDHQAGAARGSRRQGRPVSHRQDAARPYRGKGNFEAGRLLQEKYGKKVAYGLCGPVGEYQGLIAGIAFTDKDGRPSRLSARGGVGAVMGSKKVKAIVVDLDKIPPFHEPKKVNASIKEYAKMLQADGVVTNFYAKIGTMGMADVQNQMGGLPVRNFSARRLADVSAGEKFKMGGDYIGQLNTSRGAEPTHACMPGCVIQCSTVYHDAAGKEVVSPVEYETLGLLGTNCGITDPDNLAQLNYLANDLGVDTIELGATLAVLMEAGLGAFGDVKFMTDCLVEIHKGSEKGRIWAQGTARVGAHYKVRRVPVIKKQAISAYDPRVVEATGISMMTTAQGADHPAGNLPRLT